MQKGTYMFCYVMTGSVSGLKCDLIRVEVDFATGLPCFQMVGYLSSEVKEARERVKVALKNSGHTLPAANLNVNLSPASIKKSGTSYDLPIAVGILAATGAISQSYLEHTLIIGELGLDGDIRKVRGILPITMECVSRGIKRIILPAGNAPEASLVPGIKVIGVSHLKEVCDLLSAPTDGQCIGYGEKACFDIEEYLQKSLEEAPDFTDVHGQENVKRAAMIAAAGFHNMLMIGPPGAGKSMLAKRLPGILPPLTLEEALETTKIHSVAGTLAIHHSLLTQRPFRSPHHTVSDVALVGGGINPMPGEISLAHNGVLFLDELPEYKRSALEVMRQPLEDRKICISRAKMSIEYPASFMLVAAMNPCPCGHYNDPTHECTCSPGAVQRYLSRISGPLLDRIDIQVEITPVPFAQLHKQEQGEPSAAIRQRVCKARNIQQQRFAGTQVYCNAQMSSKQMRRYCTLDKQGSELIKFAMEKLGLSARAYDRILKVARTIADLDPASTPDKPVDITPAHLSEAINYRALDRSEWGN